MNLHEILGSKYPIIQGGMAHIAKGSFAASVSEAGAMGMIGTGGLSIEEIEKEIEICRSLTDKPFGLNVLLLHRQMDELAEMICKSGIGFITTGAGNPGKYYKMWKEAGIKVFPLVSNRAMAMRMESLGVDGLIAEGMEAGGHIGEVGSMVLIKEIADAVDIPVVAAGGIGTGSQLLAAEVLGAVGVQIGTVLLASEECPIHENYKEKVIKAKTSQVTVVGRINGMATRIIKNEMARVYIKEEKAGANKEELELLTLGALRKAVYEGDMKNGSIMAGQVVGQIEKIQPMKEIIEDLYESYIEERKKLCQKYQ